MPSSPPKYARSGDSRSLTVYVRPRTTKALGQKARSYTHLLKSKLYKDKEKRKSKQFRKKKKIQLKDKNSTRNKSSKMTETQELMTINDNELNRCKALLHADSTMNLNKKTKKTTKTKQRILSDTKNVTSKTAETTKNKSADSKTSSSGYGKNAKTIKNTDKSTDFHEKKKNKILITETSTNRPINEVPFQTSSSPSKSFTNSKPNTNKPNTISKTEEITKTLNKHDDDKNSVISRVYHFVKDMFQLSDDFLDDTHLREDRIVDLMNEAQHHHSRKLLSIDDDDDDDKTSVIMTYDMKNYEFDICFNDKKSNEMIDNLSYVATSILKRQLLSVKPNKHLVSSKTNHREGEQRKPIKNIDESKSKVGGTYRYRISRYHAAQKSKHMTNRTTPSKKEEKVKHSQRKQLDSKSIHQNASSLHSTKFLKRKLLEYVNNNGSSCAQEKV